MKIKKISSAFTSSLILGAMVFSVLLPVSAAHADTTANVTIVKYLDGQMATATSANNASFPMNATWNATNIGAGTGQYNLMPSGYAPANIAYEAQTVDMDLGASYATNEVVDGTLVGADCTANPTYSLVGYSTGDTMADALAATATTTAPDFTNIQGNEFVIVWNKSCTTTVTPPPANVTITVASYLDGALATPTSVSSTNFPMSATWTTTNIGSGTGQYILGPTGVDIATPYEASTGDYSSGANYATNEVIDGTVVGSACNATSTTPSYALVGYTTGDTMAAAVAATTTVTSPNLTNITTDKYVIVWNKSCVPATGSTGTISGTIAGGVAPDALAVTSVTAVNSSATADGTFTNGWKYLFNITVPSAESHLSMKFDNWMNTAGGTGTVLVANNMRISSMQADNSDATILLTAPGTYSSPLNMTADLDTTAPGKQVQVLVETAIPLNSVNGSYTTNFGVQTLP